MPIIVPCLPELINIKEERRHCFLKPVKNPGVAACFLEKVSLAARLPVSCVAGLGIRWPSNSHLPQPLATAAPGRTDVQVPTVGVRGEWRSRF